MTVPPPIEEPAAAPPPGAPAEGDGAALTAAAPTQAADAPAAATARQPADARAHQRHVTRAKLRLGLFALVIAVLAGAVMFGGLLDVDAKSLQADIRDYGPLAPVLFIVISGVLSAAFVPGPVFATLAGLLFGPVLAIPLGVIGAAVSALIGCELGARLGRGSAEVLAPERLELLAGWLRRRGLATIIGLRLAPAMPDALVNYAIGLTRVHRWKVGVGTLIGAAPRTIGWSLIGATVGGASAWLGTGGGAMIIATDALGVVALIVLARRLGVGPRTLLTWLRPQPTS